MSSVRDRRIALIRALESGEYKKTTGVLSSHWGNDDYHHCCIGVQRRIATRTPTWEYEENEYPRFRRSVGASVKLQGYLMAMNDGNIIFDWDSKKKVRVTYESRDFPFIARFLRKVWRLTDA